jgi:SAM-dependent methyltransferase
MACVTAAPETFEQSYWTEDSQYRKFEGYAAALAALRDWHHGLMRLIDPHLPRNGRRHVDAGCGHGAIVHELLERGWDAHGFDTSRWIIEQARRHAPEHADRFAAGELQAVPFDGRFDLITCLEVLEHIPQPLPALRSLADRLTPGGRLVVTTPNRRPLLPWRDQLEADPTHVSVHEPAWWRGALEAAGLHVLSVSTFLAVPVLWRLHPALSLWIPLGRRTAPGILIVAER